MYAYVLCLVVLEYVNTAVDIIQTQLWCILLCCTRSDWTRLYNVRQLYLSWHSHTYVIYPTFRTWNTLASVALYMPAFTDWTHLKCIYHRDQNWYPSQSLQLNLSWIDRSHIDYRCKSHVQSIRCRLMHEKRERHQPMNSICSLVYTEREGERNWTLACQMPMRSFQRYKIWYLCSRVAQRLHHYVTAHT